MNCSKKKKLLRQPWSSLWSSRGILSTHSGVSFFSYHLKGSFETAEAARVLLAKSTKSKVSIQYYFVLLSNNLNFQQFCAQQKKKNVFIRQK